MVLILDGIQFAAFSVVLTALTIYLARRFNIGVDSSPGVQRAHRHWAPRLGGVPIFIGLATWICLRPELPTALVWLMCLAPAFAAGLAEDLTQKVGPWPRLLLTMTGAALAWFYLDVRVERLGPGVIDALLASSPVLSLGITLLFVSGASHALNIIDGYNGLASSYAMAVLVAVLIVALRVNDAQIIAVASGTLAATYGFFMLNFPYGRIFLGDGGSYLLGTVIAFLLVLLVSRHPEVSPMFAAVLLVYPVWETLFSIYRRRARGQSSMRPDAAHLHSLVHKRLVRSNHGEHEHRARVLMNSATTLYALALTALTATAAMLFWQDSITLLAVFFGFIGVYLSLYRSLVRFTSPRRLSVRGTWSGGSGGSDEVPELYESTK